MTDYFDVRPGTVKDGFYNVIYVGGDQDGQLRNIRKPALRLGRVDGCYRLKITNDGSFRYVFEPEVRP